jgi:AraC family transcriptional regulator
MPAHKLRQALAYIEQNLAHDLTVEAIARSVGMSTFHFAHGFRTAAGEPPHKYLMRRRHDEARRLLRKTKLSMTEIAQRIGYGSPSHFSVAFQKLARMSPSEYRRLG